MPRYHFGSVDGHRDLDGEGTALSDDAAARLMAVRYAGEMLRDDPTLPWRSGGWRVEVTDDAGALLFTVATTAFAAPAA